MTTAGQEALDRYVKELVDPLDWAGLGKILNPESQ